MSPRPPGNERSVRLAAVLWVFDRGGEAPRLVNAAELGEAGQQRREGAIAVARFRADCLLSVTWSALQR
jgi:hypothetical protein